MMQQVSLFSLKAPILPVELRCVCNPGKEKVSAPAEVFRVSRICNPHPE